MDAGLGWPIILHAQTKAQMVPNENSCREAFTWQKEFCSTRKEADATHVAGIVFGDEDVAFAVECHLPDFAHF